MADPYRQFALWLKHNLDSAGHGAAAELARRLRISNDKISKMMRADEKARKPQAHEVPLIEDFFGELSPFGHTRALRARARAAGEIPIVGYVGDEDKIYPYNVGDPDYLDRCTAPTGATERTVAVEIRGKSLGCLFDRWIAYYDNVHAPVTSDLIGELCIVGLSDDHVLIKKIERGRAPDRFNLRSETESLIENVEILWATKVIAMMPGKVWRH
jgi:hypothetical protein